MYSIGLVGGAIGSSCEQFGAYSNFLIGLVSTIKIWALDVFDGSSWTKLVTSFALSVLNKKEIL